MHTVSYTHVRNHLSETMDQVIEDHRPIKVTRGHDKRVVMMSEEDYDSMVETLYLFSNPRNAERLLSAMKEIDELIDSKERKK